MRLVDVYDATSIYKDAHKYYDEMLSAKLDAISQLAGVERDKLVKINPADFIEKNKYQHIDGYDYVDIGDFIKQHKRDDTYLISPLDDNVKTANQIAYKENKVLTTLRASKCACVPISGDIAKDFFIKNHRQSIPNVSSISVSFGLVYKDKLVAVMTYDKTKGGVRGGFEDYELLRLAFAHDYRIHGGASKLQGYCETALYNLGEKHIMSYSNATINSGKVYEELGFKEKEFKRGQTFVITPSFELVRLITLCPQGLSNNVSLASNSLMKCHIGGNKKWVKDVEYSAKYDMEAEVSGDGSEQKDE